MAKELTDKELLAKTGFIVECESPFEISLEEDGYRSRATGLAARLVVQALRDEYEREPKG